MTATDRPEMVRDPRNPYPVPSIREQLRKLRAEGHGTEALVEVLNFVKHCSPATRRSWIKAAGL